MSQMTSRRPYLIRAFYDWIIDNGMTPYLSVDAMRDGVVVPHEYIEDGEIILNLSLTSVRNLELGNDYILFDTRFSGRAQAITVPVDAVRAIFSKENGEGMMFMQEDEVETATPAVPDDDDLPPEPPPPGGRPALKLVK